MKLTIELSPAQAERLRQEAQRLGLAPADPARAAIVDLPATPGADFKTAASPDALSQPGGGRRVGSTRRRRDLRRRPGQAPEVQAAYRKALSIANKNRSGGI
jgi:hypothetical protein